MPEQYHPRKTPLKRSLNGALTSNRKELYDTELHSYQGTVTLIAWSPNAPVLSQLRTVTLCVPGVSWRLALSVFP